MKDPQRRVGAAPDLVPEVMQRLGYSTGDSRRFWQRDRTLIPSLVIAVVGLAAVLGSLFVIESTGGDPSGQAGVLGDTREVGHAIRRTRSSFSRVDEAILRVLPEGIVLPVEQDVSAGPPEAEETQVPEPAIAPCATGGGAEYRFGIEATGSGGHGYGELVAMAPGRST